MTPQQRALYDRVSQLKDIDDRLRTLRPADGYYSLRLELYRSAIDDAFTLRDMVMELTNELIDARTELARNRKP